MAFPAVQIRHPCGLHKASPKPCEPSKDICLVMNKLVAATTKRNPSVVVTAGLAEGTGPTKSPYPHTANMRQQSGWRASASLLKIEAHVEAASHAAEAVPVSHESHADPCTWLVSGEMDPVARTNASCSRAMDPEPASEAAPQHLLILLPGGQPKTTSGCGR